MDIFLHYLTPEYLTLTLGAAGGTVIIALIVLAITARKSIGEGFSSLWQNIFSQGGLFYFGMALFMVASVVEAGPVLNKIAMHGALWGYGGHMLVFAFDMIAAVSLRARLNARRVFDRHGMRVQMWGIWLPALVSIAANLAGALQSFNAADFNNLWIFAWILPFIGAVFPSMIVVLSLAADHIIDTTAITKKIDVKEFEAQEQKRVEVLKVRLKTEQDLLKEERRIAEVRQERDETEGGVKREWIFMRWLRPETVASVKLLKAEIEAAVLEARKTWELQARTRDAAMKQQLEEMKRALEAATQELTSLTTTSQVQARRIAEQQEQLQLLTSTDEGLKHNHEMLASLQTQIEAVAATVDGLKRERKNPSTSASTRAARNEASTSNGNASKTKKVKHLHLQQLTEVEAPLQPEAGNETRASREERAFNFIEAYQHNNEEALPSLEEIMLAVPCSQGSASNYRAAYRKRERQEYA